jgi:hypothetical protein
LLAADIPAAVARLEQALAAGAQLPARQPEPEDEREGAAPVSLRLRAFPLIDLLKRAAAKQADVMWDRG